MLVSLLLSTMISPIDPSFIPIFSSPKFFVLGILPVANITLLEIIFSPLLNSVDNPFVTFETEVISCSVITFIFEFFNSSVINLEISLSKPLKIFLPLYTKVTLEPNEEKIPANSSAI